LRSWDWTEAEKEYKIAIGLDANYATAHFWYGKYLSAMGRFEEAIAELRRAANLEPLSLMINAALEMPYSFTRRFDDAIELNRKAIELDSNFPYAHGAFGDNYLGKQMYEEALKEYQRALDLSGENPTYLAPLAYASALAGRKGEALRALEDLKAQSKHRYVSSYHLAIVYIGLGELDQSFQYLQQAYEKRDELLMFLKVNWVFDPLRSDPRFQDLLRKMNFPKK
jgi:tetratricopeptide (TPR) repeat protein